MCLLMGTQVIKQYISDRLWDMYRELKTLRISFSQSTWHLRNGCSNTLKQLLKKILKSGVNTSSATQSLHQ